MGEVELAFLPVLCQSSTSTTSAATGVAQAITTESEAVMAKYTLQNLAGEALSEYARKDAALKGAKEAGLGEGDFIVVNDKGETVHPAPKGEKAKADKPKRQKAQPIDTKIGEYRVKSSGSYVDVLDAEDKKIFICPKSLVDTALTLERGDDLRKYSPLLVDGKAKAWILKGATKTQEKAIVAAAKKALADAAPAKG